MPRLTVRDSVGVSLQSVTFTKSMVEDLLRCGDHESVASYIGKTIAAHYREQLFLPEFCHCVDDPVVVPDDFLMGYEFEFISAVSREFAAEIFTHVLSSVYNPCCDAARFHVTACSGYHAVERSKGIWIFEHDGSVKPTDAYPSVIELITPPMKADACFAFLPLIFSFISAIGQTNASCGLHFTVGSPKLRSCLDGLEFFTRFSSSNVLSEFNREDNHYCAPVTINRDWFKRASLEKHAVSRDLDISMVEDREKYRSINFSKLGRGLIELRAMGGAQYESKLKSVLSVSKHFLDTACRATCFSYKDKSHNYRYLARELGIPHVDGAGISAQKPPDLLSQAVPIIRELGLQLFAGCAQRDPDVAFFAGTRDTKTDKPWLHILTVFQYFAAQFSFKGYIVNLRAYINPFGTLVFAVSRALPDSGKFQQRSLLCRTISYLAEHLPRMLGFACFVSWDSSDAVSFVSKLRQTSSIFVNLRKSLALRDPNHIAISPRTPFVGYPQSTVRLQELFGTSIEPLTALHNNVPYVQSSEFLFQYLVHLRSAYLLHMENPTTNEFGSTFVKCLAAAVQDGVPDIKLLQEVYLLSSYTSGRRHSLYYHKYTSDSSIRSSKVNALLLLSLARQYAFRVRPFVSELSGTELSGIIRELVSLWEIQAAVAVEAQCATSVSCDILIVIRLCIEMHPSAISFIIDALTDIASCPSPVASDSSKRDYLVCLVESLLSNMSVPLATRRFFFEAIFCGSRSVVEHNTYSLSSPCIPNVKALLVDIMQDYLCTGNLRLLRILVYAGRGFCNTADTKTGKCIVTSALWTALGPVSCGFSSLHDLIRITHEISDTCSSDTYTGIKNALVRAWGRIKSLCKYPTGTKFCSSVDVCARYLRYSLWRSTFKELLYNKPAYFKSRMIVASRIEALFMLQDKIN